jgi:ParB-like chromosome segregation protein Spo0J
LNFQGLVAEADLLALALADDGDRSLEEIAFLLGKAKAFIHDMMRARNAATNGT